MFIWPVEGSVSRGFDYKSSIYVGGMHAAIDIPAAIGVPFRAVADGVVASVGWDIYSGHFVAVDHIEGWRSLYRHLSALHVVVRGQAVGQGQVVGYSGNTGYTTGPHLHFDLWHRQKQDPTAFYKNNWWAHNPELYLGQGGDMTDAEYKRLVELLDAAREEIAEVKGKVEMAFNEVRTQASAVAQIVRDNAGGGGLSMTQARQVVRQEIDKTKLTA